MWRRPARPRGALPRCSMRWNLKPRAYCVMRDMWHVIYPMRWKLRVKANCDMVTKMCARGREAWKPYFTMLLLFWSPLCLAISQWLSVSVSNWYCWGSSPNRSPLSQRADKRDKQASICGPSSSPAHLFMVLFGWGSQPSTQYLFWICFVKSSLHKVIFSNQILNWAKVMQIMFSRQTRMVRRSSYSNSFAYNRKIGS